MKEKETEQWEYNHWLNPSTRDLNKLGADDWEAYAVTVELYDGSLGRGTSTIYYLKRRVQKGWKL